MDRGVESKNSVENSKKQEEIENLQKNVPRPKVMHGSGLSISYTAIGLIQVQFWPKSKGLRRTVHSKSKQAHITDESRPYIS
jgi:hypothetical protein